MGGDHLSVLFMIAGIAGFVLFIGLIRMSIRYGANIRAEWQRFADTLGGNMDKGRFSSPKITVPARQWSLVVDTYLEGDGESSTRYTRMLLPYTPLRPFYFLLQPRRRTSKFLASVSAKAHERVLAKLPPDQRACYDLNLRGEEILFADSNLDNHYLLRATDSEMARRLFAQPSIRRLLNAQPPCTLSLKPPNMDKRLANTAPALGFQRMGLLTREADLRSAYDLMVATIEEMSRLELAAAPAIGQETAFATRR